MLNRMITNFTMKEFADYIRGLPKISSKPEKQSPLPMFRVGDVVQLWNPYEGAFIISDIFAMEPERYKILEVDYDASEEVFRYQIEPIGITEDLGGGVALAEEDDGIGAFGGDDLWYSEDWLSLPGATGFASRRSYPRVEKAMKERKEALESKIIIADMEADLRDREIDRMLDIMRTGSEDDRDTARAELAKLVTEGGD